MIINHNIPAQNTYNRLTFNNSQVSKSLEKLSSGLRINRAGDDAAGLAISEKMRGQIRGLDQAVRNSQDGISLIQTGEGALNEVHSMLLRMRELAVQAGNDTNTDSDRAHLQNEVNQLLDEIDRVSNTTEFNTRKLLSGEVVSIHDEVKGTMNISKNTAADITFSVGASVGGPENTVVAKGAVGHGAFTITRTGSANTQASIEVATGSASMWDIRDQWGNKVSGNVTITYGGASIGAGSSVTITIAAGASLVSGSAVTVHLSSISKFKAGDSFSIVTTAREAAEGDVAKAMTLQIGANSGQTMNVGFADTSATALKLKAETGDNKINLTTKYAASASLTLVDQAAEKISGIRASLGAAQNRLEHTVNNLSTTSENLGASESRVRDVDMAKQMTQFTKDNILVQSATAMLAQANQTPQSVLQLLQ
ncbi:flagellin [Acetonema longum]|uniref:Flagellin n=1 Tax=Acetonema longum DSM 6540 TaxID=1009370 RepID=F7NNU9_9FIRM|nr:flagellin [Acetonema longum]EGO62283.1 hypothetical protein ALO_18952 [Acetonema longum DSM 6540]